jgi:hypothetical protein
MRNQASHRIYEVEPYAKPYGTMFRVAYNNPSQRGSKNRFKESAWAYVCVQDDGLAELWKWYWFGIRSPEHAMPLGYDPRLDLAKQEVWEWLMEWELIELRPIGPEDSEYFATLKLTQTLIPHLRRPGQPS